MPVPVGLLRIAGRLAGKGAAVGRLTGSLLIDDSKIRTMLDWTPPHGPDDWEL
jgi:UDP-glucose 4-epimerase